MSAQQDRPTPAKDADSALTAVIAAGQLAGRFHDGYTEDDVNTAFTTLADATGLRLVCLWQYHDSFGCGGNSQWFAKDRSGRLWDLAGDVYAWLAGEQPHPGPPATWTGRTVAHHAETLAWTDGQHNYAEQSRP